MGVPFSFMDFKCLMYMTAIPPPTTSAARDVHVMGWGRNSVCVCVDGARQCVKLQELTDRFWLRSCADLDTPLHMHCMGNTWSRDNRRRGLGHHRQCTVENGQTGAFMRKRRTHLQEIGL